MLWLLRRASVLARYWPSNAFLSDFRMKMAPSIGVNLRVTGHCDQGDRKYMEDVFSVAYQHTKEGQDLEYAYFGIFDGHGGKHAAIFAKEHLMDNIVSNPYFWSDIDEDVLKAIKEGFISTHMAMYKVLGNRLSLLNPVLGR